MRTLGRRIAFWRSQNMRSKHSFAILIYFVCFASQNAILSQPSADSSFQKEPCPRGGDGSGGSAVTFLPRNKRQRPHSTQLRNEPTPAETRLWYGFLRTASPRWNRQRIIDSYIVDFFCLKAKLVVELDGSQHYDENGLVEYDRIRTEYLEALELKVLRFTNFEIENDFCGVRRKIQLEVERRVKTI